MQIDVDPIAMQDMIKKINQLDKQNKNQKIIIDFLKERYEAMSQTLHIILELTDKGHDNKNWKQCSSLVCQSSKEVLEMLGL